MGKEVKIGLAVGIFFVLLAGIWFVGPGQNPPAEDADPNKAAPQANAGGGTSATAGRSDPAKAEVKRVGDAPKDGSNEKRPVADDKRPGSVDKKAGEKAGPFEKPVTKTAVAGAGSRRTHVVKAKETYWSLAVHYFGDPAKAKLIEQANPDIKPANLRVGATLVIPEAGTAAVTPLPLVPVDPVAKASLKAGEPVSKDPVAKADAKSGKPGEYVVQPGDRLQDIVRRKYGDLSRLGEVVAMNKDVLKGNANLLPAGRTIKLPEGERTPIAKTDLAKAPDPKQPGNTTVVAESPKRFTRID